MLTILELLVAGMFDEKQYFQEYYTLRHTLSGCTCGGLIPAIAAKSWPRSPPTNYQRFDQ